MENIKSGTNEGASNKKQYRSAGTKKLRQSAIALFAWLNIKERYNVPRLIELKHAISLLKSFADEQLRELIRQYRSRLPNSILKKVDTDYFESNVKVEDIVDFEQIEDLVARQTDIDEMFVSEKDFNLAVLATTTGVTSTFFHKLKDKHVPELPKLQQEADESFNAACAHARIGGRTRVAIARMKVEKEVTE